MKVRPPDGAHDVGACAAFMDRDPLTATAARAAAAKRRFICMFLGGIILRGIRRDEIEGSDQRSARSPTKNGSECAPDDGAADIRSDGPGGALCRRIEQPVVMAPPRTRRAEQHARQNTGE